jgi:hypothetical protein
MAGPRSVRLDPTTDLHLAAFAARRAGLSHSGAAALLVEEGLRMDAHPGVLFREGPAGRRAVLVGGPDVWEVVRSVKAVRSANPGLAGEAALDLVAELTGLQRRYVDVAVGYYAHYPDEVDGLIGDADMAEEALVEAAERRTSLLGV